MNLELWLRMTTHHIIYGGSFASIKYINIYIYIYIYAINVVFSHQREKYHIKCLNINISIYKIIL